jgi:hypothetical protein
MGKKIILTFDYELFLGKNTGTIINSVIKPTEIILDVLRQNNAKAIFFVDATWLLFLKKNSPDDLKTVSEQIKAIIRQGSSVELHLHPQWVKAYKKGESVFFDTDAYYKLHSFSQEEIMDIFKSSIDLLESITRQKITCFRAGGFCIEPFEQLKQAFETFKIKYDFSSVPGVYLKNGNSFDFDFTDAPQLPYYSFQDNVKVPVLKGEFTEVPLSTYNNNPFYRFLNNILLRLNNDKISGNGTGIQYELSLISRLVSKKLGFSKTFLTLDAMHNNVFKYILRNHFRKTPLIVCISHPKIFSGQSLMNLSYLSRFYNTLNSSDLDNLLKARNTEQAKPVIPLKFKTATCPGPDVLARHILNVKITKL